MATVRSQGAEVLFVASEDVLDLNDKCPTTSLAEYFSRLLPHAMALRYAAGANCWRPSEAHASIIIDDPLLRNNYGFLNFKSLLSLTKQHDFHTTIAFIPHNFRRSAPRIIRMFRENPSRLSICYHGNDHTEAEFASTDWALLHTLFHIAGQRMDAHYKMTGLPCDKVMVFPQEQFSEEALTVIKSHNFYGVVNSAAHPPHPTVWPTIGEVAQPAVRRYGGFPIFSRTLIHHLRSEDIAFNLFFGRPVLLVDHHEVFRHPERVIEIATRINSVEPQIRWSNLATALSGSTLKRTAADGTYHVRAYSHTVRASNDTDSAGRFSIEWGNSGDGPSIEQVLMDGAAYPSFETKGSAVRLSVELAPNSSATFSLVYPSAHAPVRSLGLRKNVQALLRRRLSEARDNYLSKNQSLLTAVQALRRVAGL